MSITRREFIKYSTAGAAGALLAARLAPAAEGGAKIRIGARHFNGNLAGARQAGIEGVEISMGSTGPRAGIADPAVRAKIKEQKLATGVEICSISLDPLNSHPLFADPLAAAWVEQCIAAARDLGAAGMLLPFFGKANLVQGGAFRQTETDNLVTRLKEQAPAAQAAGVGLGVECTLTGRQYLELLERVGSPAVGAYYDIGNCTNAGFDVPGDIRLLKGRMTMIHFKDGNNYLGEGKVKMEPVAEALHAIGYQGWIVLETTCPSKNTVADCKRNADYIRALRGLRG